MADMSQILNDESGFLKEFRGPVTRPLITEAVNAKIRSLEVIVHWWIPNAHEELNNSVRHLRAALNDIIWGRDRLGVSLREMARSADTWDPLYRTLVALTYAEASLVDLYHPGAADRPLLARSEREDHLSLDARGGSACPAHYGYSIDNFTVGSARDVLDEIVFELHACDLRRPVVSGCMELFDRCLHQLQGWEEGQVEGDELRYRWSKADPVVLELWDTWVEDLDAGRW